MQSKRVSRLFAGFSALVLLATSLFWAILSARLQTANADNLIDTYLFESVHVFQAATFPGAHTFLLKWPLFFVAAALGGGGSVITAFAVISALVPVAALAGLLYKLDRRPAAFGLWCLVLSSMLLLVPAQPAPGTLLPVNFAMLATRNIEYACLLGVLVLLLYARRLRDRRLALAGAVTALLVASDKLFAPLLLAAVCGLLLILLVTRGAALKLPRRMRQLPLPVVWLIVVLAGITGAYALLFIITASGLTTISTQGATSPYGFHISVRVLLEAGAYAALSLLTLFGANPAYDHLQLSGWPQQAVAGLARPLGLSYGVNVILLALVCAGAGLFVMRLLKRRDLQQRSTRLVIMLLLASLAALAVYTVTNHYYPADSRYLAVSLFALLAAAAHAYRQLTIKPVYVAAAALVLLLSVPITTLASYRQYDKSQLAMHQQQAFNLAAATALNTYHVDTVIGDYWDVAPVRNLANYHPAIVPLASCDQPLSVLSSSAWQKVAAGASVGYLLNSQPEPTGFQRCTAAQIRASFGTPTRQISLSMPGHQGSVLFMYNGSINTIIRRQPASRSAVQPYKAADNCQQGSLLDITAHEDDDLIFMNPDLQTALRAGQCVTSAYLTAGDAGANDGIYPAGRRSGVRAAYAEQLGVRDSWRQQRSTFAGKPVSVYTLQAAQRVRIIFYNLPDGNTRGQGFTAHYLQSLAQLRSGAINDITSIDGQTSYSRQQLISSLVDIMQKTAPTDIHTQDYSEDVHDGDHSDHHAAGWFAKQAFRQYGEHGVLRSYIGYPGRALPANVRGAALQAKRQTFYRYAQHDPATCDSDAACASTAYAAYLQRQYSRFVAGVPAALGRPASTAESAPDNHRLLTSKAGGFCAISDKPQSLYCKTSG